MLHIYKFKKTLSDQSLAVVIVANDLLDASRYMHLLQNLEPENYKQIDLDCVRVLDVEQIEFAEEKATIYQYPYPKYKKG